MAISETMWILREGIQSRMRENRCCTNQGALLCSPTMPLSLGKIVTWWGGPGGLETYP